MHGEFTLPAVVSYWDVDRDQRLTLGGLFKLLQEAAIKHADQHGLGAPGLVARGETWVLNRMAVAITRYPRYEEAVRVVTWSAGIRGFRGYRDLRIYCGEERVVSASSLWIYVKLATKLPTRVPPELADSFPVGPGAAFRPELDKLRVTPPSPAAAGSAVSLRYSDFDGNGHMNNTAYLDCLQTALVRGGFSPHPTGIEIQFLKEIAPTVATVEIALESRGPAIAFGLSGPEGLHAQGMVTGAGAGS
jgi:medium-chain acyl-[acyl-carrier-protein] hydrolase